jgi:hypothetical protein
MSELKGEQRDDLGDNIDDRYRTYLDGGHDRYEIKTRELLIQPNTALANDVINAAYVEIVKRGTAEPVYKFLVNYSAEFFLDGSLPSVYGEGDEALLNFAGERIECDWPWGEGEHDSVDYIRKIRMGGGNMRRSDFL